ncbi:MAG: threonine ammonia-lyase [Bacteroidetes bacterium]|uniref:L-threonine dehydratase n=1 Tax=Candidatus Egerieousia excrementavium TaxID=2840778 RepID=A0A9D9DJP0_9BACT|nr:threonine ammonia-lyase [Candidatus Egerieousia excrementavium]
MANYFPKLQDISKAKITLAGVALPTPLSQDMHLSGKYEADVLLKREDLQIVRSYKIRGAYNKIKSLTKDELSCGVVCASAGNHAQGVALSCRMLNIKGSIFMPATTPKQKIEQVKMFGNGCIEIMLEGDTFDDSARYAIEYARQKGKVFIPPFDDPKIIEGQATIGMEIMQEVKQKVDYLFIPIGGGGLASGIGSYFKQISPDTKIIGVEPAGAASMKLSLDKGAVTALDKVDKFVDGAAVQRVGELTFNICKEILDDIVVVPEGAVCTTILELYNKSAMVVEPAGALSVSALRFYADKIKGKNVVCIISGSNNDITRMEEIREKSLLYERLKHYFIIRFPQRSGALLSFIRDVLGPEDDITHFSYIKKTNKEQGPAIIGIEVPSPKAYESLVERMRKQNIVYEYLNDKNDLFEFLI